jgi:hypothetical protein
MADLYGFDANQVEPTSPLAPLPAGTYLAVITHSMMKTNKAGTGRYLQLTFRVVEGAHQGRLLWARLNLEHPNPAAVQLARAELSALCRAVGVLAPNDSAELHDQPLRIQVVCKKRPDTGAITNEVKGYNPQQATAPAAVAAPTQPASNPPWRRP